MPSSIATIYQILGYLQWISCPPMQDAERAKLAAKKAAKAGGGGLGIPKSK